MQKGFQTLERRDVAIWKASDVSGGQIAIPARGSRARRYHFTRFGSCLGYIDEVGHYYGQDGSFGGSVSDSGAFFDEHGIYRGYIDVQGCYWDCEGRPRGYFRAPGDVGGRSGQKLPES